LDGRRLVVLAIGFAILYFFLSPARPALSAKKSRGAVNDVRFGSKADIGWAFVDVRFTPNSGHSLRQSECPLWANKRRTALQQVGEILREQIFVKLSQPPSPITEYGAQNSGCA
jgi:hypothetical protein